MLVALIDDGINTSVCPDIRVKYDLSVGADCVIGNRAANDRIITDHGTTCARIIAKYAPNAEFCSLRIFHREKLRASCGQLATAMEWCLAAKIPILHMSLGTSQASDFKQIRSIAARMIQQRQIIVAACSNSANFSVPARFNGVLGVVADKGLVDDEFAVSSSELPDYGLIRASSRHKLTLPSGHEFTTQITNSYAAPTVTAAVHKILEQNGAFSLSAAQINTELAKDKGSVTFSRPDFIEDAIILNPRGVPVLKQHFFFNCLKEYSFLEQISTLDENIVYMAPQGLVSDGFLDKAYSCKSLLYGGRLPDINKSLLCNGLVWSEDCCKYPENIPDILSSDLPAVINLYGQGLKTIDVACQLRNLFATDGYHCRGLCDFPYSYLYDWEFLPKGVSPESALRYICQMYQPDIIINICQNDGIALGEDVYSIIFEDEVHYRDISENGSCIKSAYNKNDILLLYKKILNFFL